MTTDTFAEITEGDWKTLATTEITHLTDEEKDYLPRAWDEWIARVRRDAAREALGGLADDQEQFAREIPAFGGQAHRLAGAARSYRDRHYPEEARA